jgi:hypothetical protein
LLIQVKLLEQLVSVDDLDMDWRTSIRTFLDSVSYITDQPLEFKADAEASDDMIELESEMDSLRAKVDNLTDEACHLLYMCLTC